MMRFKKARVELLLCWNLLKVNYFSFILIRTYELILIKILKIKIKVTFIYTETSERGSHSLTRFSKFHESQNFMDTV